MPNQPVDDQQTNLVYCDPLVSCDGIKASSPPGLPQIRRNEPSVFHKSSSQRQSNREQPNHCLECLTDGMMPLNS